ncbi:MAG: hypothetical protein WKG07_10655 [Hymenobacter sp.]
MTSGRAACWSQYQAEAAHALPPDLAAVPHPTLGLHRLTSPTCAWTWTCC